MTRIKTAPKHDAVAEFLALSDEEKERVWESYNRPIPFEETRALTPAEHALHVRFLRKAAGRPVKREGAARIQATMERGLLRRADEYARRHGMSRSQLIARGVEEVLASK
ncbi:MAG TPA: hypothetical protein VFC78_06490 [Tepidisphaeraceae bacterium]|nr:hypothetical protein [Tepidisphaeraceae bacterium]